MSGSTGILFSMPLIAASTILLAGVIDDFRSRKFHNWLFLVCCAVALVVAVASGGISAMITAPLGFGAGIALFLPLVLVGIVGAGDMKLLAAFGIVAGWQSVLAVAVLSILWGAIFGVVQVILKGQLGSLLRNMYFIVTLKAKDKSAIDLHSMPFTVALLMGWLTHLVYRGMP